MSQSVSIASLMSQAGRARPKSSSELMLEDAVRWVLWQYARGALRVDNDARALMTLPKMTLGSQQWLIQFIAGRRLSQSQAAQLWAKHDPAQRGWIDACMFLSFFLS
jgi:DNA-binding PucR family transcriptional regulator